MQFNGMGGPQGGGPSKADLDRATLESRGTLQWALGVSAVLYVTPWVIEFVKSQIP